MVHRLTGCVSEWLWDHHRWSEAGSALRAYEWCQHEGSFDVRLMITVMGVLLTLSAVAEGMKHHQMPAVTHDDRQGARQGEADNRVPVSFPGNVYDATLASMREHLRAIDLVIASIAAGDYDRAALAAEQGLGIGHQHGVDGLQSGHAFMPTGMRRLGHSMHMNARELVVALRDAEVTEDVPRVLRALNQVTAQCVSCHDVYRLVRD